MTDLVRREAEFLLYQTEDGSTRVEVRFDGETAWLSLGQMAELFQRDKSVISRHIKNVFEEGELDRGATVAKSATVQREGEREVLREVEYFNLDRHHAARAPRLYLQRALRSSYGSSRERSVLNFHTG